ncbi:hypothetical protein LT493_02310 [Streptomyces tricolor]|nr:hypothetical protein [Streptomyces tricolor]
MTAGLAGIFGQICGGLLLVADVAGLGWQEHLPGQRAGRRDPGDPRPAAAAPDGHGQAAPARPRRRGRRLRLPRSGAGPADLRAQPRLARVDLDLPRGRRADPGPHGPLGAPDQPDGRSAAARRHTVPQPCLQHRHGDERGLHALLHEHQLLSSASSCRTGSASARCGPACASFRWRSAPW